MIRVRISPTRDYSAGILKERLELKHSELTLPIISRKSQQDRR
jgi:hypothetical protein